MDPELTIARIASRQLGLITRRQAEAAGASRGFINHRLRTRRWEPIHRGVFRLAGTPRTREQEILAACLAGGDQAVASHWTATEVWYFKNRHASPIEITIPTSRRFRGSGIVVHQSNLPANDLTTRGVIPVTSPFRTLVNLAGIVKKPIVFELAFDDALRKGLVTPARLISQFASLDGSTAPGSGLFRRTFESRIGLGIPMSELETYFVNLLDRNGLSQPIRQGPALDGDTPIKTIDFLYPQEDLMIEVDGWAYHSTPSDLDRDRHKSNLLVLTGRRQLQFTWRDVLLRGAMVCELIARGLGKS